VALAHPVLQPIIAPAVDDALGGDTGEPRMRNGVVAEAQLADGVRIAVEREEAPGLQGAGSEHVIDVLPVMATPGALTAFTIRRVWSSLRRSNECGEATTNSNSARSSGWTSRLPSARMFASIPLNTRKRPEYDAFNASISAHCRAACSIDMPRAIGSP
jgi:hypothetical protein